jgi:serine/threonine-protein phosphatase 2A regulatory subunit B
MNEWKLLSAFGDHVPLAQFKPDDTISSLAFSRDGCFLASGDHAGRVVVFRVNQPAGATGKVTISFVTQVHAHKAKFDYFRSELSEMKVNSVKWIPTKSLCPLLITCNSHDAKLWRFNATPDIQWVSQPSDTFKLPVLRQKDHKYAAECVRTYTDTATEYLLDLQPLADQHSFLMIDIGCVKLWDLERDVPSVALHRISQTDPEISSGAVHPIWPFSFIVGDDSGNCRMFDLRQQAEDLSAASELPCRKHLNRRHQIDGCTGVSSVCFSQDGHHCGVRTFGDVQVWDIRSPGEPVAKMDVHWFPGQMDWLVSEEFVKDPFKTSFTKSGKLVTGWVVMSPTLKVCNFCETFLKKFADDSTVGGGLGQGLVYGLIRSNLRLWILATPVRWSFPQCGSAHRTRSQHGSEQDAMTRTGVVGGGLSTMIRSDLRLWILAVIGNCPPFAGLLGGQSREP